METASLPLRRSNEDGDDDAEEAALVQAYKAELDSQAPLLEDDADAVDIPPFPVELALAGAVPLSAGETDQVFVSLDAVSDSAHIGNAPLDAPRGVPRTVSDVDTISSQYPVVPHEEDEDGLYVEILCDKAVQQSILDEGQWPVDDEAASLRVYVSKEIKRSVVVKDDDTLNKKDLLQHPKEVAAATRDEILIWIRNNCFELANLKEATNLMTSRYVAKWKFVNGKRIIKMRLCLLARFPRCRGFRRGDIRWNGKPPQPASSCVCSRVPR